MSRRDQPGRPPPPRGDLEELFRHAARRLHDWRLGHDQPEQLRAFVDAWRDARDIRAFLGALEQSAPLTGVLAAWAAWARDHAEVIDPLSPTGLARLADNAVLAARASTPGAEPTLEEQEWFHNGFLDPYLAQLEDLR
ncbi:MAG TPA: hypothetical protein VN157_09125 [Caulobacter sp.]|jgi:hypothetical protein|nr:hypothetical protein [Caulobacter sp.]